VADVVGYSRLMGADEEGTLARLRDCRIKVIVPALSAHHGRLVKTTGDGLLVEFASVVDALRCALVWQRELQQRNAMLPDDQRMMFRIGINLGDVIVEGDDIYGDGVNVAARLEGAAEPGTICLSRAARDQVRDKFQISFQSLGELKVKNIARPIQAFLVAPSDQKRPAHFTLARAGRARRLTFGAMALSLVILIAAGGAWFTWIVPRESATADRAGGESLPLPQKPSIAVLPFNTIGADTRQLGIGDGLAENIIASLSKISGIFVIARNSAFAYKGEPVDIETVGQELGVRYLLDGSVQTSGERVRITAQLIEAATGRHLWAETYDRAVDNLFALLDEITLDVVTALQIELTQGELARVRQRGTDNLRAWLLVNQSFDHFLQFTREGNARARTLAEEALALDPNYPEAYVRLARTHLTDFQTGWATHRDESLKRSVQLARTALQLDPEYPDTYVLLSAIYLYLRQHEPALAAARKALDLSPNHSVAKANLGMALTYAGEPETAISALKEATRLSPLFPDWFLGELGRAYFQTERYEDAIEVLRERLRQNPESGEALVLLAAAESAVGRQEQAKEALAKFLEPRPSYSLRQYAAGEFYRDSADLQHVLDALRRAGLPE